MTTLNDIITFMEQLAPPALADKEDNIGLLLGHRNNEIKKILVSLNADDTAIDEAIALGANLIICHHPLIFLPAKSITSDEFVGRNLLKMTENKIALYVAHTNLDWADDGVNDTLCNILEINELRPLTVSDSGSKIARIGTIEPTSLGEIIKKVNTSLNTHAKYVGDKNRIIQKIAVCGGGGGFLMNHALTEKCDLYISSDFRYHEAQMAYEENLAIIDAGHFETENVITATLAKRLKSCYDDIEIHTAKNSGKYWNYE